MDMFSCTSERIDKFSTTVDIYLIVSRHVECVILLTKGD